MAYPVPIDQQSIASHTSCLTNAVESLLGHAAAKEIASDKELVNQTLKKGNRMVTHDSTGLASMDKPFRWMSLRYVFFEEVFALQKFQELGASETTSVQLQQTQGASGLWHFVIHEFRKKDQKEPIVVTVFFGSRLEIVTTTVQEKFDLLDHDDDPRIIEAALADAEFSQLLHDYFNTGDLQNPKFFKTLATLAVLGGQTLLHFCCERGLHNCIEYLLKHHSVLTAEQPWLRLADPFWQERKWGNSAFSIAAYRGDLQMLKVLVSWAELHGQLDKVWQLRDKKKQDLFQILQGRIAKGDGAKGTPKLAINFLAEASGKKPVYSKVENPTVDEAVSAVLVDPSKAKVNKTDGETVNDQRLTYRLDGQMTLSSLAKFFEKLQEEKGILKGKSVLMINLKLLSESDGKDQESAQRLLYSLRDCCRVSMKACISSPELSICLAQVVAQQLNAEPLPAWESLALLPGWDEHPGSESPILERFADALEMMWDASEATFQREFIGFDLPQGVRSCLPPSRVHIITLLGQAFVPNRLAYTLKSGEKAEQLEANLRKNFKAFNFLLSLTASLERVLLPKRALFDVTSVEDALHPSWKWYLRRLIRFWFKEVQSMPSRAASLGVDPKMAAQFQLMLDGALVHLLKMRPKAERPGLTGICQVVEETLESDCFDWKASLPQVGAYFQKMAGAESR